MIEGARNTLRAALNNAEREELISRNVAELVTLPRARKKLQRRNSWTVDEARRFLESSRDDNDPLYALWVLILVMALRRGEAMGLVDDDNTIDEGAEEICLEWQLGRVGGHPLTHKHQLKADGSVETLPLPPIVLAALKIARQMQAERRTASWPKVCICGERHRLLFTTSTGQPIEPRNLKRSFDTRCKKAGVRQIKIHDTRRTCGSLLAALDVHPRVAMAILRHSRIALTMEVYTQVPDKTTRDALKRLSDLLGGPQGGAEVAPTALAPILTGRWTDRGRQTASRFTGVNCPRLLVDSPSFFVECSFESFSVTYTASNCERRGDEVYQQKSPLFKHYQGIRKFLSHCVIEIAQASDPGRFQPSSRSLHHGVAVFWSKFTN